MVLGWFSIDFGFIKFDFPLYFGLIFYCYNNFWWWWWLYDGGGWDLCLDLGRVGLWVMWDWEKKRERESTLRWKKLIKYQILNYNQSICIKQCKIEKCINFTHLILKIIHTSQAKTVKIYIDTIHFTFNFLFFLYISRWWKKKVDGDYVWKKRNN